MKSYFLEGLSDYDEARIVLSDHLPHWIEPWRLNDAAGDAVAFLNLEQDDAGAIFIQADLSGRHHGEAEQVIGLLRRLRHALGGQVTDDDENLL
jgi:hypothetical protein